MLQIFQETPLTLTELANQEDVAVSSVWRWVTRGVKGVRLESYSRAGRRCTSREAFARFIEATTRAACGDRHSQISPRASARKQKDFDESLKYLESENC